MNKCKWEYLNFGEIYYETECDNAFQFNDGGLKENDYFKFCPYCGKEIEEIHENRN